MTPTARAARAAVAAALLAALAVGARSERPRGRTHAVEIRSFGYAPERLDVSPGDTIVWINRDVVPHTATSAVDDWDTGLIEAGGPSRVVVAASGGSGTSGYYCAYHASMKGRILVRRQTLGR